jgi:hypothetical protein
MKLSRILTNVVWVKRTELFTKIYFNHNFKHYCKSHGAEFIINFVYVDEQKMQKICHSIY